MDVFDKEILNFWKSLQKNDVRYIMVGGFAINFHGFERYTGDLDIWIEDAKSNRENLRKAFLDCGMGEYFMLDKIQFVPGWTEFKLINGLTLDILTEMKGLEKYTFSECLQMASVADIENVMVPFLHINQLIANKKAINRPKDQIDIIELEKIKKLNNHS